MDKTLSELAEEAAVQVVTAIEDAWEGALQTFKDDVAALFTKKKLAQWVIQFPSSLATIGTGIFIASLDLVRNAAAAIPQGLATGLIFVVTKQIPIGSNTIVMTQRQAMQGAITLLEDSIRAVVQANSPMELIVANRIRKGSRWLKFIRRFLSGALDVIALKHMAAVLRMTILSSVRFTIAVGGTIVLLGVAIFWVDALRNKPQTYFRSLSQRKGRAWVTTRDFQRV